MMRKAILRTRKNRVVARVEVPDSVPNLVKHYGVYYLILGYAREEGKVVVEYVETETPYTVA